LVNFFILLSVLVVNGGDLFNAGRFCLPAMLPRPQRFSRSDTGRTHSDAGRPLPLQRRSP
jgi:hypothetical protein